MTMSDNVDGGVLLADSTSAAEDNAFFLKIINMIPPQHYFDEETKQDIWSARAENTAPHIKGWSSSRRPFSEEEVRARQLKQMRYDPTENQTVHHIQTHLLHQTDATKMSGNKKKPGKASAQAAGAALASSRLPIEELKEKLHNRLELLKKNRTSLKKREYQVEKSKLKRRESKLKLRMRKAEKPGQKAGKDSQKLINGYPAAEQAMKVSSHGMKPLYNKKGTMVYSKFDFTDSGDNQRQKNEFSGKDYNQLLAKVEKRNEKLKKMKESNPEKGKTMEEKMKWKAVIDRAEGLKVKDNPDMLKKAAKTKQKSKDQRRKKWDERKERTEKMLAERQDKRRKNIQTKKQSNTDKKVKKLKKKGHLIPGF